MEGHTNNRIDCNGNNPKLLQLFVKLLDGKTKTLNFTQPLVYGYQIKQRIFELTEIPTRIQRLVSGGYQLIDEAVVSRREATVHLLLRLRGGKGGFGSLLRGAATKAGQKKTNNFDACRDMSGRRLRHVNAEKRLEEWREEEEERKLERVAEEFMKKNAKKGKQGTGDGAAQKYVEKYREMSARCVEEVDLAVREAFGNGKRKGKAKAVGSGEAKRLKIWKGKGKMEDSDSDNMDQDSSDDEDIGDKEKSAVLNNGSQLDSNKETEGSSGSVTGEERNVELSGGSSCDNGSEEERKNIEQNVLEFSKVSGVKAVLEEENIASKPESPDETLVAAAICGNETSPTGKEAFCGPESEILPEIVSQTSHISSLEDGVCNPVVTRGNCDSVIELGRNEETFEAAGQTENVENPLNFDDFKSAADMEVLGMEKLKSELQLRGLKCGGTLQERAKRLFLLKSTPIEKIPKKLLAKKWFQPHSLSEIVYSF